MARTNIDLFRESVAAFNRRDRAAWLARCDPDYENVPPREWPESAAMRGPEAIWDFFTANMDPWDAGAFEVGEVIDAGDGIVIAEMRAHVRGKSSGAEIAWCYWHVIRYRDELALRSQWFADRANAVRAAASS
jgi:ketosteroid isomerase-like protein